MSRAEGRRFGLTVGIAFLVIAGVMLWRDHATLSRVAGGLGTFLVLGGLLTPTWLGPVERGWMGMAHVISKVTTPIFMGVVYYAVLTPTGLLRRWLGGNPLRHEAVDGNTYWKDKANDRSGGLERQF